MQIVRLFIFNPFRIELVYNYLSKMIFWNMILRLIIESYLDFAVDSATNIQNVSFVLISYLQMVWVTSSDKTASVLSIILMIVVLGFPFFIMILLLKRIDSLRDDASIEKFGSTYNELRTDSRAALMYNVFYMVRRLWIAFLVTMLKKDSYL